MRHTCCLGFSCLLFPRLVLTRLVLTSFGLVPFFQKSLSRCWSNFSHRCNSAKDRTSLTIFYASFLQLSLECVLLHSHQHIRRYWFYVKNDFRNNHQIFSFWDPLSQKKQFLRKCRSVVCLRTRYLSIKLSAWIELWNSSSENKKWGRVR